MKLFLISHQDYNYDDLCLELLNIHKHEGETFEQLFSRYMLICYRFRNNDLPS